MFQDAGAWCSVLSAASGRCNVGILFAEHDACDSGTSQPAHLCAQCSAAYSSLFVIDKVLSLSNGLAVRGLWLCALAAKPRSTESDTRQGQRTSRAAVEHAKFQLQVTAVPPNIVRQGCGPPAPHPHPVRSP